MSKLDIVMLSAFNLKRYTSKGFTLKGRFLKSGFTLIELMVVIGILAALTIMALVALNPAEAQKKSRDVQRLKDMATSQSIIEQVLQDNPGSLTFTNKDSSGAGANSCSAGWLQAAVGKTLCPYASVLPTDPTNRATTVTTNAGAELAATNAYYYIRWSGSSYKICTYLESKTNAAKLINDGEATTNNVFAIFSSDSVTCP